MNFQPPYRGNEENPGRLLDLSTMTVRLTSSTLSLLIFLAVLASHLCCPSFSHAWTNEESHFASEMNPHSVVEEVVAILQDLLQDPDSVSQDETEAAITFSAWSFEVTSQNDPSQTYAEEYKELLLSAEAALGITSFTRPLTNPEGSGTPDSDPAPLSVPNSPATAQADAVWDPSSLTAEALVVNSAGEYESKTQNYDGYVDFEGRFIMN